MCVRARACVRACVRACACVCVCVCVFVGRGRDGMWMRDDIRGGD